MTPAIDSVHRAIAQRIAERTQGARLRNECLAVGLCGSQGSGKSTMVPILQQLLEERGLVTATLSLDDFYLPLAAREELGRTVHPLLKTRGVPGTHDVPLALRVLDAMRKKGTVAVPSFDKARDDRRSEHEWVRIQAPVHVVLFEGWCVGAVPQSAEALSEPVNALERDEDATGVWRRYVNRALGEDYQRLFGELDMLILLAAPGFDVVHRWRLQQEDELREKVAAEGGDTSRLMTGRQLERFISHYERLTRHILAEMPARADVVVRLDAARRKTIETGKAR
jgi:D-glycerate 3-kinase